MCTMKYLIKNTHKINHSPVNFYLVRVALIIIYFHVNTNDPFILREKNKFQLTHKLMTHHQ